jgi:acetyltransferase-like isoleucine patch superfamily enzyme
MFKNKTLLITRVAILHNTNKIAKNSIVAACSVVTKNIPDNTIVSDNLVKIIKYLDIK